MLVIDYCKDGLAQPDHMVEEKIKRFVNHWAELGESATWKVSTANVLDMAYTLLLEEAICGDQIELRVNGERVKLNEHMQWHFFGGEFWPGTDLVFRISEAHEKWMKKHP